MANSSNPAGWHWCILLLAGVVHASAATHEHVFIEKEPAWVLTNRPSQTPTNTTIKTGEVLLFQDRQVNAITGQTFNRAVRRILSHAGVQNGSQITIDFDPSYERLHLHRIEIVRRGEKLNRLQREKLKVLQREQDLDRHLYHGTLSVLAVLDDVRVGDEVDYSFTTTGNNPVFGGKFCDSVLLRMPSYAGQTRFRLLWPRNRLLRIDYQNTEDRPAVRERDFGTEYLWELADVSPPRFEFGAPRSHNAYPRVWLSEFANWQDVARWAAPIYASPAKLSAELQTQIRQWKEADADPDKQLLAALQFVQDQVRYFGIEIGPQSHQPTDPSAVFERRYGDCKDKSVLLCAILNKLGFDARPAFVNTYHPNADRLPSPLAFNHVVVYCKRGGDEFWMDPTLSYQRGPLKKRYFPNYGDALIVHPATTKLSVLPKNGDISKTIVREAFMLNGTNQPAELRVTTIMEGFHAETYRSAMAEFGDDLLSRSSAGDYLEQFPLIRTNGPAEFKDDVHENRIQITRSYKIPDFWSRQSPLFWSCDFYAGSIADGLYVPQVADRRSPLAVNHPCHRVHTMVINLPDSVLVRDEAKVIRGPAEELSYKRITSGRTMTIEFDYRTTAEVVPLKLLHRHAQARKEMLESLATSIQFRPPMPSSSTGVKIPKGPLALLALVFPIGMFVLWFRVQRRPPGQVTLDWN